MNIQKIFDKVANREIAYTYIIKKVAETPIKKDRIKIAADLMNHLQKEQDELKTFKNYNTGCVSCGGHIDLEDGTCDNCG